MKHEQRSRAVVEQVPSRAANIPPPSTGTSSSTRHCRSTGRSTGVYPAQLERRPLASRTRQAHRAQATGCWPGWRTARRFTATRSFDAPVDPPTCDRSGAPSAMSRSGRHRCGGRRWRFRFQAEGVERSRPPSHRPHHAKGRAGARGATADAVMQMPGHCIGARPARRAFESRPTQERPARPKRRPETTAVVAEQKSRLALLFVVQREHVAGAAKTPGNALCTYTTLDEWR